MMKSDDPAPRFTVSNYCLMLMRFMISIKHTGWTTMILSWYEFRKKATERKTSAREIFQGEKTYLSGWKDDGKAFLDVNSADAYTQAGKQITHIACEKSAPGIMTFWKIVLFLYREFYHRSIANFNSSDNNGSNQDQAGIIYCGIHAWDERVFRKC